MPKWWRQRQSPTLHQQTAFSPIGIRVVDHQNSTCWRRLYNKQSSTMTLLVIISLFGVWLFGLGTIVDQLPTGRELPLQFSANGPSPWTSTTSSRSTLDAVRKPRQRLMEIPTPNGREAILPTNDASIDTNDEGHIHAIPNVLIFTHSINLLTYQAPKRQSLQENHVGIIDNEELDELLALQANVRHTIDLHPNAMVRFLTDDDCVRSIRTVLGAQSPLADFFRNETTGMYKADICRGAALYETGGFYVDVDVGVRMCLFGRGEDSENLILSQNTTFVTSLVHRQSNHLGNFFQAFIGATPRHAILQQYLELFQQHYQGRLTRPVKKGPLGVILLRQAFDDVIFGTDAADRVSGSSSKDLVLGPKRLDMQDHGRIELWQEILYSPKFFPNVVPAPMWGTRRACHFVVVANRHFPLQVPLYSRVEGSRMCPKNTANTSRNNGGRGYPDYDNKEQKDVSSTTVKT